tara:strand:+ start:263 stop:742 length:480 start_codon:yes stop_codon:yes gene_type:complete
MGHYNEQKQEREEVSFPMELDLFCQWFEGTFDNWTQASSNPTKWAHIIVEHKKLEGRKFYTSSRYSYMDKPYREQEVEVTQPHVLGDNVGIIIVKNPACDMIFSFVKDAMFFDGISEPDCTYKDKPLQSQAKLYADAYHTWDKGYWQGAEGFFTFKKNV